MKIKTDDEYQAAKARIAELAGCPEDSPEEHELVTLELAVAVWESKKRVG
ncbi:MAG TPA: hypothetical protein VGO04_13780 [Ensifer sp.]|jgi:hypothetical protein|nr:hypothetical protein [Ensifer sp.]